MNKSLYKTAFHLIRMYQGIIATRDAVKATCDRLGLDYDETVDASYRECRNAFYNIARISQKGMKMTPAAYLSFVESGIEHITKDHPIGRTTSALQAFKYIKLGRFSLDNIEEFVAWIETQCQTIYTTKDENQKLKPFQIEEYKDLSDAERYFKAGLINRPCSSCFMDKPNRSTLKAMNAVYTICGIDYKLFEAMEKFQLTAKEIKYRCCTSKAKVWKEWQKKENQ